MLTGFQTEVVAYQTDGGDVIHPECAVKQHGAVAVSRAEMGMWNDKGLYPMIRYNFEEHLSSREWDEAEYRVSEFMYRHPDWLNGDQRHSLVERVYERTEVHEYPCDVCGAGIS